MAAGVAGYDQEAMSNLDLLEPFADDERAVCPSCGQRALVSLPETAASFCFACGAVSVGGLRLDVARRIPTEL
jgi:hypothetical protein